MGDSRYEPIDAHLDVIFTTAKIRARALGANEFEADEVAQLTAYKLWRRWEHHKVVALRSIGGARWRAYISEAAKNTHVDLIREHQRRIARQQRAHEQHTGTPPTVDSTVTGVKVDNVESHMARDAIVWEILCLPRQQRRVAVRMFVLEMSAREVADELGIEAQTVRKHARAAREALRQRLLEAEEPTTPR